MAESGDPIEPQPVDPAVDHDDRIGFSSAAALQGRPRVVSPPEPEPEPEPDPEPEPVAEAPEPEEPAEGAPETWSYWAADVVCMSAEARAAAFASRCTVTRLVAVYGALAADRPVLLIGPAECHVTEVFARADCGWRIAHGDAAGMVALLLRLAAPAALGELRAKAAAGREALAHGLSRDALRARWADEVETAIMEAT
jgi:hypothetical protein